MANKTVTVLTPNGRRPIIKVTPNTTILQVLEEACQKQNFNPDDYDLKHFNRVLDVNLIFRYANIPNNACLEMVKCNIPRKVSNVTICIQLEDGSRSTGEFPPTANVDTILKDLNVDYNIETVVIIYMQREIYGKDFESVTLRSLGLGGGKALFRLLHRNLEIKEQAHVYVPPQPKVPKTDKDEENRQSKAKPNQFKINNLDPISIIKAEKQQFKNNDCKESNHENKIEPVPNVSSNANENKVEQEPVTLMEVDESKPVEEESNVTEEVEEPKVEFLGERNALLFNQAGAKAVHQDDIPDSFFELTIKDAQALLRDVKRNQSILEDSPLMTSALRELEKDKDKLNRLNKYQQTIIRIQFPNQFVLQGLFKPLETVENVKEFVRTYLEKPESEFTLYTAPPRCDLETEKKLFDLDLVPSAIVYYSGKSDLKPEIKSKLTDPTAASYHAVKTRVTSMRNDRSTILDDETGATCSTALPGPSASTSGSTSNGFACPPRAGPSHHSPSPSSSSSAQKSQVPKWFKLSSK